MGISVEKAVARAQGKEKKEVVRTSIYLPADVFMLFKKLCKPAAVSSVIQEYIKAEVEESERKKAG